MHTSPINKLYINRWKDSAMSITVTIVMLLLLAMSLPTQAAQPPLYGKVKIVEHHADYKVKIVSSFPDLCVKRVSSFADEVGEWQMVEHHADFTVQFVSYGEDFSIMYVEQSPGWPNNSSRLRGGGPVNGGNISSSNRKHENNNATISHSDSEGVTVRTSSSGYVSGQITSFRIIERSPEYYDSLAADRFDDIYTIAEIAPHFPGGEDSLSCFIKRTLQYPVEAREKNITGKVYVTFVVRKDGRITNPRLMRDIGSGCGNEAIRIVQAMPRWIPGQNKKREAISVQHIISIAFEETANQ